MTVEEMLEPGDGPLVIGEHHLDHTNDRMEYDAVRHYLEEGYGLEAVIEHPPEEVDAVRERVNEGGYSRYLTLERLDGELSEYGIDLTDNLPGGHMLDSAETVQRLKEISSFRSDIGFLRHVLSETNEKQLLLEDDMKQALLSDFEPGRYEFLSGSGEMAKLHDYVEMVLEQDIYLDDPDAVEYLEDMVYPVVTDAMAGIDQVEFEGGSLDEAANAADQVNEAIRQLSTVYPGGIVPRDWEELYSRPVSLMDPDVIQRVVMPELVELRDELEDRYGEARELEQQKEGKTLTKKRLIEQDIEKLGGTGDLKDAVDTIDEAVEVYGEMAEDLLLKKGVLSTLLALEEDEDLNVVAGDINMEDYRRGKQLEAEVMRTIGNGETRETDTVSLAGDEDIYDPEWAADAFEDEEMVEKVRELRDWKRRRDGHIARKTLEASSRGKTITITGQRHAGEIVEELAENGVAASQHIMEKGTGFVEGRQKLRFLYGDGTADMLENGRVP